MCGIAGIASVNGTAIDRVILERMRESLVHRGPDTAGTYLSADKRVGLAHRRLSIIDLSDAGNQPMCNEDGSVWITFNGEIFNYRELRGLLTKQGHQIRSWSDTEVIIHLYEEYGQDCLDYLNGQFAFVIWDERRKKIFGARDHTGIKPLYYFWDGDVFAFASELKAILPVSGQGEIDYGALIDFLVLQYVPSPRTIYKHIRKLEAGSFLIIENNSLRTGRFWFPQPVTNNNQPEEVIIEKLDEILYASVKRQLVSDVPLGVFLSGGVDSSTITYYMSKITGTDVNAYSVGFEEKEYSELDYAEIAARCIKGVRHHKMVMASDKAFDIIQQLLGTLDEPFADQAVIPTYLMSRYAREYVTVCLSGEGSDELFGGYDRYRSAIQKVKTFGELTRLNPELRPYLRESFAVQYEDYLGSLFSFSPKEISLLMNKTVRASDDFVRTRFREFYLRMDTQDELERVQRFDISTYLADNLLFKVDRASMLASLEVRVPFLDPELVGFSLGLPFHLRYRSHMQKYVLKKLMTGRLPNGVLYRRKMGFTVPIYRWFQDAFYEYVRDTLLSQRVRERGIFRMSYIKALLDPERMRKDPHVSLKIWCLLMFEEWCRRYYDEMQIL